MNYLATNTINKTDELLGIVVVFYHPSEQAVQHINLLSQSYHVVVVDNTEEPLNYDLPSVKKVMLLRDNKGIATALNAGINWFVEQNYDYAFLLDQDSEPSSTLIDGLLCYYRTQATESCCLVAPNYYDRAKKAVAPFVKEIKGSVVKEYLSRNISSAQKVMYVNSSGSLISLKAFKKIGLMLDELFIGFVDIEWCLRAQSLGYHIVELPEHIMSHEMGGEPIKIFSRSYSNHAPVRHYYYYRNLILLLKKKYIPWSFKKMELIQIIPRFLIYTFFNHKGWRNAAMMVKGIYHGLIGRGGKLK